MTNNFSYAENVSQVDHFTLSTFLTSPNATATAADPAASNQVSVLTLALLLHLQVSVRRITELFPPTSSGTNMLMYVFCRDDGD